MRTSNGRQILMLEKHQPIGLNEKGIIVATGEDRVFEWVKEFLLSYLRNQYSLRHACAISDFSSLVQMSRMSMAFIEIGFFGDAMIGHLEKLRKRYPKTKIVLFTVSDLPMDEVVYYLHLCGGCFLSFRDSSELIHKQLKAIFEGKNILEDKIYKMMEEYRLIPMIKPHLTHKEIEVLRCIAKEMKDEDAACCLGISESTLYKHLNSIYYKFGIHNKVGALKLAVTKGILPEKVIRSLRFEIDAQLQ